jgi:hypothetical protein
MQITQHLSNPNGNAQLALTFQPLVNMALAMQASSGCNQAFKVQHALARAVLHDAVRWAGRRCPLCNNCLFLLTGAALGVLLLMQLQSAVPDMSAVYNLSSALATAGAASAANPAAVQFDPQVLMAGAAATAAVSGDGSAAAQPTQRRKGGGGRRKQQQRADPEEEEGEEEEEEAEEDDDEDWSWKAKVGAPPVTGSGCHRRLIRSPGFC